MTESCGLVQTKFISLCRSIESATSQLWGKHFTTSSPFTETLLLTNLYIDSHGFSK